MIAFFIFIFGTIAGSFLNVCIHRMPNEESIILPRSRCPACGTPIAWYDNIPILSYLILGGKCRHCHKHFSFRYLAVELLTAVSWVYLWHLYGLSGRWMASIILFSLLIAISATDFETGYIPDLLTFPGIFAGIVLSTLAPSLHGRELWYQGFFDSMFGFFFGVLIFFSIAFIGTLCFKKDAMGGGDIKLLGMLGAFLGIGKVVVVIFLSSFLAFIPALVALIRKEKIIYYGPYIAMAGALCFLYGNRWVEHFTRNYFFGY